MAIPLHLTIQEALSLANTKDAPWIKKRRTISTKRILYSVRSDFLVYYTDIWHRNRFPDTDRVLEIMKSIELEGEPDNRIYLAWIRGIPGNCKLLCFDGNHRREALIRLFRMRHFICWVDLDILMDVEEKQVIHAFRRINMGVSIADIYLDEMDKEINYQQCITTSAIDTMEKFIEVFKNRWKFSIVDKNRTRVPYCTKNDLIDLCAPLLKIYSIEDLLSRFEQIHIQESYKKEDLHSQIRNLCEAHGCYLFHKGILHLKRLLES